MSDHDPWGLTTVLPWLIAGLLGYYALRTFAAVLLLALSRVQPNLLGTALRCAPATLRPMLRRVIAGGLLGVALTSASALAAPAQCPASDGAVPALDRAIVCAPAQDPQQPPGADPPSVPMPAPAAAAAQTAAEQSTYVVRPGDSLWQITAQRLGPAASESAIAAAWPQLWQTNRSVVGDDPGLILPGTALTLPAPLMNGSAG